MLTLLLHETDYRRCATRLRDVTGVAIVTIDDNGVLSSADGYAMSDVRPHLTWLSASLFLSPSFGRSSALLRSAPLQWAHTDAAGLDAPVFRELLSRGIRLSQSHMQAIGIAEYVLASVLDHFQGGAERRATQANREWQRNLSREVNGSQWLIVGFGAIGQAVATRARAFDARVVGMRRTVEPHPLADEMLSLSDLRIAAAHADVIVLALPITAETHHVIDRDVLRAMRSDAVLVNVGRGELVNEQALIESLDEGRPAHANLDVFEREPYPADGPLWTHPKVTMTCHTSALSSGLRPRNDTLFIDNLQRFLSGAPLRYEVPPQP
jgi:glyoxylate/hydroxypyruvate reductase